MLFYKASLALFLLFFSSAHVLAVPEALHSEPLSTDHFRITISTQKNPTINTIHSWFLHIEALTGEPIETAKIQLQGGMPDHDHGLPTAPKMTKYLGEGNYLIEGMKFHMAGRWQIDFIIRAKDIQDTLSFELSL